jgi:hypothetical protein
MPKLSNKYHGKPLLKPPKKVGGTASAGGSSRDSVKGSIKYDFPPNFPAISRDRVKTEEISAAHDCNNEIGNTPSDWKVPALRVACVIRVALVKPFIFIGARAGSISRHGHFS